MCSLHRDLKKREREILIKERTSNVPDLGAPQENKTTTTKIKTKQKTKTKTQQLTIQVEKLDNDTLKLVQGQ